MTDSFEIGMVTEVEGINCKIATFDNMNHSSFLQDGDILHNPKVNSFILIKNGFDSIVGRISSETIWDQKSTTFDFNFDDRFTKKQIKRILDVQVIGIFKNSKFHSGISRFPMIGNICVIPSNDVINSIYMENSHVESNDEAITIGDSLNDNYSIDLSVNSFFASHIGIFGNTGSGKSNTLHKLYYELFKLSSKYPRIHNKSKYIVIDFNGEYSHEGSFGITNNDLKKVYRPGSTDNEGNKNKIPISEDTFLDIELLSIIFSATVQTQRPFLGRVIRGVNDHGAGPESLSTYVGWIIRNIFTGVADGNARNELVESLIKFFPKTDMENRLEPMSNAEVFTGQGMPKFRINGDFMDLQFNEKEKRITNYNQILDIIQNNPLGYLKEFQLRCHLQNIINRFKNKGNPEFIVPLLHRIDGGVEGLIDIITVTSDEEFGLDDFLTIISMNHLRGKAKQLIAMLISKMVYDKQKYNYKENLSSVNLIIDEAHNVLSYSRNEENDNGMDYRLGLFEEIIKEGRKFGFFLTLSSQRPSDISPTIISQVHNFFIHKLVNERDLQIINYSLSTLDPTNKKLIPTLAPGACVVTGSALNMPIIIQVDYIEESHIRPQSDTINLIETWSE